VQGSTCDLLRVRRAAAALRGWGVDWRVVVEQIHGARPACVWSYFDLVTTTSRIPVRGAPLETVMLTRT
jgi:hypothetical protein